MNFTRILLITIFMTSTLAGLALADPLDDARLAMETKQFEKARQILQVAIDEGNSEAMFLTATLYHGNALEGGLTEALKYYEMAGNAGHANAQYQVADIYLSGPPEIRDPVRAGVWYRKAAENGIGIACFRLGMLYKTGAMGAIDMGEAAKWYELAAERDVPNAQFFLAQMYLDGEPFDRDPQKALYWLQRASVNGFTDASMEIAQLYLSGDEGIPVNPAEAVRWLTPLASGGSLEARHLLGTLYREGRGVKQDPEKAAEWFRLAAIGGYADAQYELGKQLLEGQGAAADKVEAGAWWQVAADLDQQQAKEGLTALFGQLTDVEKLQVEERAREIHTLIGR